MRFGQTDSIFICNDNCALQEMLEYMIPWSFSNLRVTCVFSSQKFPNINHNAIESEAAA